MNNLSNIILYHDVNLPTLKSSSKFKNCWKNSNNLFFFLIAGNFVADENGSTEPLRSYKDKTLVIVLPGDLTVFDIEW